MTDPKQIIFQNFLSQYQALITTLAALPLPPHFRTIINQNFDTGFLWVKEGFNHISFEKSVENGTVNVPPAPTQPIQIVNHDDSEPKLTDHLEV